MVGAIPTSNWTLPSNYLIQRKFRPDDKVYIVNSGRGLLGPFTISGENPGPGLYYLCNDDGILLEPRKVYKEKDLAFC